jgi:GTPase SAR1 family protein
MSEDVQDASVVFFTGTAGAGKTTLVRAFRDWLKAAGYDATVLNLDPGNESPALEPDVDIREWVRLPEVMEEYDLGPNGAQIAAADMIALKVFDVRQALEEFRTDFILVDTPGQVELFAFRESSRALVDALGGERAAIAFLFDPALAKTASGFASLLMLSATVEFRFRRPTLNVLTKSDVLTPERITEVVGWGESPEQLVSAVEAEAATPDVQLSSEIARAIETLAPLSSLLPVSSNAGDGLEMLYRTVQRIFTGGEDAEVSQAMPDE